MDLYPAMKCAQKIIHYGGNSYEFTWLGQLQNHISFHVFCVM